MVQETALPPMSHGTSRLTEPVKAAGNPPLTFRPIAPAPNVTDQAIRVDPLANPARSVPLASTSSFSAENLYPAGPQFSFSPPVSWSPSPTISTPFTANLNSAPIAPEQLLSHKRPRQEPNALSEYDPATEHHRWGTSTIEKETAERLTTLYVDPEDHPAYKELQKSIHLSHDEQDCWKACTAFHESYKSLKDPVTKLDNEIQTQRRKLNEKEAARDDKESNLDALILLGTSFMLSKCERFGQVRRLYDDARRKLPRSSTGSEQRATGEDWDDFLNDHGKASREIQQCENALEYISTTWGNDKIRYYGWATKPLAVCQLIKAAAMVVPNWEEAGIKLNRLRNYRDRRPRNPIACGKRSISWKDFKQLGQWQGCGGFEMPLTKINGRRQGVEIIPYAVLGIGEVNVKRLGFDEFGILVVKTTGSDDEPVITLPAPPWGMSESSTIAQAAEEQLPSPASLPGYYYGDAPVESQDEAPPPSLTRGSARLAARLPTCYASQLAPEENSLCQRARKGQKPRKNVVNGDEDALSSARDKDHGQKPKSQMVDAATETDERLWGDYILAKARGLTNALHVHVISEDTPETGSLGQEDEEQVPGALHDQHRPHRLHEIESPRVEESNLAETGRSRGHLEYDVQDDAQLLETERSVPVVPKATLAGQDPPVTRTERFSIGQEYNEEFKRLALEELNEIGDEECWGAENSRSCRHYLSRSYSPTVDPSNGPVDAHFSTLSEAKGLVDRTTPKVPIFTRCSNAHSWKLGLRPIVDYLTRAEKVPTNNVYVQKYSLDSSKHSYETVSPWEVIIHFVRNDHGANGLELWNALELRNHLKERHVPAFLRNTNCSLLAEMRQRAEREGETRRGRKTKKAEKLPGKDPLHFALIADGGMNTYPHSDSHGYSTFLTVQEGELIFGWLSHPDDEMWDRWAKNPCFCKSGKWCYLVMKAADSVYFPSGMPHYVIRRKGTQTFILGGHVLQWSNMDAWASFMRKQMDHPATTNEHMNLEITRRYVEAALGLVVEAVESQNDRLEYLGGSEEASKTIQNLKNVQRMVVMEQENQTERGSDGKGEENQTAPRKTRHTRASNVLRKARGLDHGTQFIQ